MTPEVHVDRARPGLRPEGRVLPLAGLAVAAMTHPLARLVGIVLVVLPLVDLLWAWRACRLNVRPTVSGPGFAWAGEPVCLVVTHDPPSADGQITASGPFRPVLPPHGWSPSRKGETRLHAVYAGWGEVRTAPLVLTVEGPLGLAGVVRGFTVPLARPLLVAPAVVEAVEPRETASRGEADGLRARRTLGAELFRGLREHQPGDRPGLVHWPATARQGRLVVVESEPFADVVTIALDLADQPRWPDAGRALWLALEQLRIGNEIDLVLRTHRCEPRGALRRAVSEPWTRAVDALHGGCGGVARIRVSTPTEAAAAIAGSMPGPRFAEAVPGAVVVTPELLPHGIAGDLAIGEWPA